jgi:hypothetical protein
VTVDPKPPVGTPEWWAWIADHDPTPPPSTPEWRAWLDHYFPKPPGKDHSPTTGAPEWHDWMDRHSPPRSDEWFHSRRARERSQARTATAKEWAALAEWRRWRAEHDAAVSPSERRAAGR